MSRDDWYCSTSWSESIEAAFEARLRRARSKAQYLRVQALYLVNAHPEVALKLLDRYFELDGDFTDCSLAHTIRADAYLALGRMEEAIASYEAALAREAARPTARTDVSVAYPYLVATRGLRPHFARALEVLKAHSDDVAFPVNRFRWHAARALILAEVGSAEEARSAAKLALEAAAEPKSEFRYHQKLGLVSDKHSDVIRRLRKYCDA
jgi:tetratricopeptide (TPR) repeat protein